MVAAAHPAAAHAPPPRGAGATVADVHAGARTPPRQRRSAETLADVLDAARALIREHGIEHLTLRAVARRARKSPAVVYRYVRDREDLLALLVDGINGHVTRVVARALAAAPDPIAGAAPALARALCDTYERDPVLVCALLRLPASMGACRVPAPSAALAALAQDAIAARRPSALARDPRLAARIPAAVQAVVAARHRHGAPALDVLEPALVRMIARALGRCAPRVTTRAGITPVEDAFAARPARPRRSDAQPGYAACLEAAAQCMAAHGVDVSTQLIAERAGVSVGSMFRYFPTKRALVAALASDVYERFGALAAALVQQAADVDAALDAVLRAALHTWQHEGALLAALAPAMVSPPFLEPPPLPRALVEATRDVLARAPVGTCAFDDAALATFVALHAGQALVLEAVLAGEPLTDAVVAIRAMLRATLCDDA